MLSIKENQRHPTFIHPAYFPLFAFISSLLCQIYHQYPDRLPKVFVTASNSSRNSSGIDEIPTSHHYIRHPSLHYHYNLGLNYMLPPAPIAPFRGGLRTVSNSNSNGDSNNNHNGNGNTSDPINKSKPELILEASSSDHHNEDRGGAFSSSTFSTLSGNKAAVSSWTPEEYPDPWTNPLVCGGAATASLLDGDREGQPNDIQQQIMKDDGGVDSEFMRWFYIPATLGQSAAITQSESLHLKQDNQTSQSQQTQKQKQQSSRLLFCDPDQVLNKDALRTVAEKLEAFSKAFSYHSVSFTPSGVSDENNNERVEGVKTDEGAENDADANKNETNVKADEGMVIPRTFPQYSENNEEIAANSTTASSNLKEDDFEDLELRWVADEQIPGGNIENAKSQDSNKNVNDNGDSNDRLLSQLLQNLLVPKATQQRLYSDSVGGVYSAIPPDAGKRNEAALVEPIEVAIALVKKINLPAILRADSYFFYSDQDDMVNDAAQYFARYIHDTWSKHLSQEQQAATTSNEQLRPPTNLVLIFISTQDRICYISSGSKIAAVLPWWRLERVVQDMKPNLRKGQTGEALSIAIDDLSALLIEGPPTIIDRLIDFLQRFGIVMSFTLFTFVFATWGECRDRRKRLFFAIRRSRMTAAEKEKARLLQKEFNTKMCPICLEPFESGEENDTDENKDSLEKGKSANKKQRRKLKRVDSFGIPTIGTDDLPIKLLRCGHIFDESCWKAWVDSGHGNPWICPVCRQDVGRVKIRSHAQQDGDRGVRPGGAELRRDESTGAEDQRELFSPSTLLRPVNQTRPHYNSVQSWSRNNIRTVWSEQLSTSSAPLTYPTLHQLHPGFSEGATESTPLFGGVSNNTSVDEEDDY
ncbi:hypothetical protein ACHAXS_012868 [Conticribra weissflogii]